jgi:hypothetical protein
MQQREDRGLPASGSEALVDSVSVSAEAQALLAAEQPPAVAADLPAGDRVAAADAGHTVAPEPRSNAAPGVDFAADAATGSEENGRDGAVVAEAAESQDVASSFTARDAEALTRASDSVVAGAELDAASSAAALETNDRRGALQSRLEQSRSATEDFDQAEGAAEAAAVGTNADDFSQAVEPAAAAIAAQNEAAFTANIFAQQLGFAG